MALNSINHSSFFFDYLYAQIVISSVVNNTVITQDIVGLIHKVDQSLPCLNEKP